ncbi:hypothetical protein ACP70R_043727 [Stipagrostis hirtigluma subsp. patula]
MAPPRAATAESPSPAAPSPPPPPPPAAAGDPPVSPPPPAATGAAEPESSQQQDPDLLWLQTLSEPELDVLISIKEQAVKRATDAGNPNAARRLHLRMLRAFGNVLLQDFRQRLKGTTPININMFDRLSLLSDPGADVPTHMSNREPEVVTPSQDQPMQNGANRKRKQMKDVDA